MSTTGWAAPASPTSTFATSTVMIADSWSYPCKSLRSPNMATLRQILPYSHPLLKTVSAPCPLDEKGHVPEALRTLAVDMLATSRAVNGAGLAAVQVGVPARLFVMDLFRVGGDTIAFFNPEIIETSEETTTRQEGCLSMPGVFLEIDRPSWVRVQYIDPNGDEQIYRATDFAALCIQHEMDHLNGIRNIDRLSPLKRSRAIKQFEKLRKQGKL